MCTHLEKKAFPELVQIGVSEGIPEEASMTMGKKQLCLTLAKKFSLSTVTNDTIRDDLYGFLSEKKSPEANEFDPELEKRGFLDPID